VSLGSLPSALLIPPLNLLPLGLAGVALSALRRPRWRRLGRWATGLAVAGLFVLSLPACAEVLIWSLEVGLPRGAVPDDSGASKADRPGAIVILSGDAALGDATGGIEPGSGIGVVTLDRMRAGAVLARRTGLPILVTGYSLEERAVPIAVQMAHSLRDDFGTTVRWVEPAASDTWENAQFSAKLLRADGITSVYVVTDAWHMKRSLMAFARTGIAATPAPTRFDRLPVLEMSEFVPHIWPLQASYYAMHEWIGCLYYALRS
jgi:uncharacterized SAM-binding protein YcdF (DUF218 family)